MDGNMRREAIMERLRKSGVPVAGTLLASELGVSRQVIVQDIALLRATDKNIMSTNKGYLLFDHHKKDDSVRRVFRVKHANEQMENELYIIVDQGAKVLDVIVEHEIYGQLSADLYLKSRSDVDEFLEANRKSKSKPLKTLTEDVHYHTVEAKTEEILQKVEKKLTEEGYLLS